jgi:hypothetical protein
VRVIPDVPPVAILTNSPVLTDYISVPTEILGISRPYNSDDRHNPPEVTQLLPADTPKAATSSCELPNEWSLT